MRIATTKGLKDTSLEGLEYDTAADKLIEAVKQHYQRQDGRTLDKKEVASEVAKIINRRLNA